MENVTFAAIYRHPRQHYLDFQNEKVSRLESFENSKVTYYISGDVNISSLKYFSKNAAQYYLNSINSTGSRSIIDKPTRFTSTSHSLLDHYIYE